MVVGRKLSLLYSGRCVPLLVWSRFGRGQLAPGPLRRSHACGPTGLA